MYFVNIHDAKTHLSSYLEKVVDNEEIIVICKNGNPIATLNKFTGVEGRKLGAWKGKVVIEEDFDDLPEEFISNFS